ncbi:MAG: MBOAT family O-acyltransferase, partial [Anaerolineales bacterium]|nr:MBOAT family O-acyltransferase [Anaerolineales bacterium]
TKPSTNFVDFALYLAWFPKMISGPLELGRKFLPLLAEKRTLDNAALARSLTLILVGLFRASILAGALALLLPSKALNDPLAHGNPVLLWAVFNYMFYLYNQFAGYSDIARGVSGLFGIPLTRNFAQPFFSKDFSDFWKRWHISLSSWLQAYVYMPISRAFLRRNPSRSNVPNLIVPPLVTMLVSGLWHGAESHLLVWGILMGLFIMLENVRNLSRPANYAASLPLWRKILGRIFLIGCLFAATVPFLLDLTESRFFLRQALLGWDGVPLDPRPIAILAISLLLDWVQYHPDDELVFLKWPTWAQTILVATIPLAVIIIDQLQSAPPIFIYP